jgi:hypothetical protein
MATQIIPALNPIDRSKRNAIGFTLPFYNTQPFTSNYTTQQALRNNIINYMENKSLKLIVLEKMC